MTKWVMQDNGEVNKKKFICYAKGADGSDGYLYQRDNGWIIEGSNIIAPQLRGSGIDMKQRAWWCVGHPKVYDDDKYHCKSKCPNCKGKCDLWESE
jgi:hypothetical protein